MKFNCTSTLLIALSLILIQAPVCQSQENETDSNLDQAKVVDSTEPVELTYGMARNLVTADLGNPEFESIIPSIQRARLVYSDDTLLVFDRDSLILVQTVHTPGQVTEGFVLAEGAEKNLKIDARLLASRPKLAAPEVEQRLVRGQAFLYAPGSSTTMTQGIHFSPAAGCLFGDACGGWGGTCGVGCQQIPFPFSGSGDPLRRLMFRIKNDVCHVCP